MRHRSTAMMGALACVVLAGAVPVSAAMPTGFRDERPMRGVWLRPPGSLVTLESQLQALSEAGVQDLFLETAYHGLATNDSDVLNDRFGFDYLAEAIVIGARYGIRVHAWLETGYLSYAGSANYLLNANPGWAVINAQSPGTTGDISGQVFVNLGNPGVQALWRSYVEEISDYPGLWGVHIDYHRFPVGPNGQAPYSYDDWSRLSFFQQFGADPLFDAESPGEPFWDEYLQFRRDGISECANQMHMGMNSVNPDLVFSCAIFASSMTSSSQLSKCQDWPRWAADGYVELVIPMAYGPTQSSIRNDVNLTVSQASGRRVVPGLALSGASPHPSITDQLNAIDQVGFQDFVMFDGAYIVASQARLDELRAWIDANANPQLGDVNLDHYVDARDIEQFDVTFADNPRPATGFLARYDLTQDGQLDFDDEERLWEVFASFRYGEDGIVDDRDLLALQNSYNEGGAPGAILNLHDLDGDGDVDYHDEVIFNGLATVALPPDLDADRDGLMSIDDLYKQAQEPIDVNRDGTIDDQDLELLEDTLRASELEDMKAGRQ